MRDSERLKIGSSDIMVAPLRQFQGDSFWTITCFSQLLCYRYSYWSYIFINPNIPFCDCEVDYLFVDIIKKVDYIIK